MISGTPPPLDLRKLRYFVAVAEELHFGRAAARLYITQPVLSRQIQQLELEIGAELLHRSARNVELTLAGEQLLEEARGLLARSDAARRRIQRITEGESTLRIGFFIGDNYADALHTFHAERSDDVKLELHRVYWDNQTDVLNNGLVDVSFVHLPIDDTGLELVPVRAVPRVAVVQIDHPAAAFGEVCIEMLADDPVIRQRGASEAWEAFHNVDPRPDGSHPRSGPEVDCIEEKIAVVAAGQAISFLPATAAAVYVNADVAYVPVVDIPPIEVGLAWRAGEATALVRSFVDAVTAIKEVPLQMV